MYILDLGMGSIRFDLKYVGLKGFNLYLLLLF